MDLPFSMGRPSPPTTKIMIKIQATVPSIWVEQTGLKAVIPNWANSYLLQQQPTGVSNILIF